MASKTEICNMALSHIGVGKEIANIDTEQSQEASACRRFFDTARDATLRAFHWPFATKITTLGLIESLSDNNTAEFAYSYRYPTDCLKIRRVKSGSRNDSRQSRSVYKILKDSSARIIHSDVENAEVEYTERVEDPSFYPSDFEIAFSFKLAAYIVPRLGKGDPFKLKRDVLDMYKLEIDEAKATSVNEEQSDELVESEFVRKRA